MGLLSTLKRWIDMIFKKKAEDDFKVKSVMSPAMEDVIKKCANIYIGLPPWLSEENDIRTINFAKSVCSETARLATLAIGITIEGSARAEWLQKQIDAVYFRLRDWTEYACAYGTVFLKPNGDSLDLFTPKDILLVEYDNLGVKGIIFKDTYTDQDRFYTRLEYHRFVETTEGETTTYPYYISNRAYVSRAAEDIGDPIPLSKTKWAGMIDDTPPILKANGERLDGPMFGILRMPAANNVDIEIPLGLPVFAEAIEELKDLDVAYSRNAGEIWDSQKIILADDRLLMPDGQKLTGRASDAMKAQRKAMGLPRYVKNVFGDDAKEFYEEINPQLNTDARLSGINALLSQIGYKCGFSNGYFVFNEKTGMVTATQVESDDRRTIQLIKDVRDKLENALDGAVYALSVYADLYGLAPVGTYKITYDFGDITYNREEDRARWWQYVMQGKVPAWMYFQKFEGMSEEDAKAMVEEATPKEDNKLFGEE